MTFQLLVYQRSYCRDKITNVHNSTSTQNLATKTFTLSNLSLHLQVWKVKLTSQRRKRLQLKISHVPHATECRFILVCFKGHCSGSVHCIMFTFNRIIVLWLLQHYCYWTSLTIQNCSTVPEANVILVVDLKLQLIANINVCTLQQ